MRDNYRICVVASEDTFNNIFNSDDMYDFQSYICDSAARVLNVDPAFLINNATISFADSDPGPTECDLVLNLRSKADDLDYAIRLMDKSYNEELIIAESGDGRQVKMSFGEFKEYLYKSCTIVAGLANATYSVAKICTIYDMVLFNDQCGGFKPDSGSVYAEAGIAVSNASEALKKAYGDAWEKAVIQFSNVLRMEPKYQFNVLGTYLPYDQEKLDRIKHAQNRMCCPEGGDVASQDSDYDFVIRTLTSIYSS